LCFSHYYTFLTDMTYLYIRSLVRINEPQSWNHLISDYVAH
jgi:hypothetical protein